MKTTLSVTQPGKLDANGDTLIVLRPDMGQNWAPLFVRVSTSGRNSPIAYCALYHGSPGVPVQQSQFIDDTFLGNGDTSSMISGTPVLFGEALLFSFQGGTPGDTAIATVYGMTSDIPPNLDLLPQVPGTHFSGKPTTEIGTQLDPTPPAVTRTLTLVHDGFYGSSRFDVRQWNGYSLSVQAITSSNPATNFNPVAIDIFWSADPNGVTTIYQESVEFWADNQNGPMVGLGTMLMQDAMHGPYMAYVVTNNALDDSVAVQITLEATTRTPPHPFFRQQNGASGMLLEVRNAVFSNAGTGEVFTPAAFGQGTAHFHGLATKAARYTITDTQNNILLHSGGPIGANLDYDAFSLILPKRAVFLDAQNADASSGTYSANLTQQLQAV
jgi:hypothetical protein